MPFEYDILFSIHIVHQAYKDGKLFPGVLVLQPTDACKKALGKHSLLFRQVGDVAMVLFEKIGKDEATEISRPIKNNIRFSFLLDIKDKGFVTLSKLPESDENLFGRMTYHFTNMTSDGKLDVDVDANGTLKLTQAEEVGAEDALGALASNIRLSSKDDFKNYKKLEFFRTTPGAPQQLVLEKELNPGSQSLKVDLIGKHQLNWSNDLTASVDSIYISNQIVTQKALGIIDIHKDNNIDYTKPITYKIAFEKK